MSAQVKIGRAAATPENLATIVRFRRDAAAWLAAQGQDQWVSDWPDTDTMLAGFERDLEAGTTWFASNDADEVQGIVTINRRTNPGLWTPEEEASAVFVHRLTVARSPESRGLGARLLTFAGEQARDLGLPWVRLDAWTTNGRLHRYYADQGFRLARIVQGYRTPSAACFERLAAYR